MAATASSTVQPEAKSLAIFSDGISDISYLEKTNSNGVQSLLASTSWDGTVRVHDTTITNTPGTTSTSASSSSCVLTQTMESGPLLSLATPRGMDAVVTGGLDGSVRLLDIPTTTTKVVGQFGTDGGADENGGGGNSNACSCVKALTSGDITNQSLIASASWNKTFCLWDIRQSSTSSPVAKLDLPGKAFAMDYDPNYNRVVIATSGRRVCFVDVRSGAVVENKLSLERESSLKYPTRCVQFFTEGHGIALGSVEGRVAVEFLDDLGISSPMKKYAFKCHRVSDTVYPVNCIAFHPRYKSTFATGGCDGTVVLWDGMNKKKLTALPSFPTSVSALAFNHDGSEMAIASSYTHEEGDREHPQDEIYIRPILDSESQPKTK